MSKVEHPTALAAGQDDGLKLLGLGHADDGKRPILFQERINFSLVKIFVYSKLKPSESTF